MDRSEQAKRYYQWKRYQHRNEKELTEWAHKRGLEGSGEFFLAEAFSRVCLEKAIRRWFPFDIEIRQMGMYDHFDAFVPYPISVIEGKFRLNDSDEYPTDDITMKKADYVAMVDSGCPAYLACIFFDGVVRFYNIGDWNGTGTWTHSGTTAGGGDLKTEMRLQYDPKDAVFTTTITLPDWTDYAFE